MLQLEKQSKVREITVKSMVMMLEMSTPIDGMAKGTTVASGSQGK